ncbi:hypothetical protein TNCT_64271 [Trichonephila clavata]|uniref:Uncharacterized protein n=1 Tax=Trichonephila clavata TaxID=2740835 RepID=A0A8X6HJU7_TRICU|nr:hypothetical protein TNCT_64271 [Trichonephila clavata]
MRNVYANHTTLIVSQLLTKMSVTTLLQPPISPYFTPAEPKDENNPEKTSEWDTRGSRGCQFLTGCQGRY